MQALTFSVVIFGMRFTFSVVSVLREKHAKVVSQSNILLPYRCHPTSGHLALCKIAANLEEEKEATTNKWRPGLNHSLNLLEWCPSHSVVLRRPCKFCEWLRTWFGKQVIRLESRNNGSPRLLGLLPSMYIFPMPCLHLCHSGVRCVVFIGSSRMIHSSALFSFTSRCYCVCSSVVTLYFNHVACIFRQIYL